MPNSNLRRAAENKQVFVVKPRHNTNIFFTVIEIVNILVGLIKHTEQNYLLRMHNHF